MVDDIVEAAWRVVAEEGYAAANTNRIAERAGVSVGSLYQYFSNKDAIVAALQRRHHSDMACRMAAAFEKAAGQPLETATRQLVEASLNAHLINPQIHRTLADVVPASTNPDTRSTLRNGIHTQISAWLTAHHRELIVTDFDVSARVLLHLVESNAHAAVVDHHTLSQTNPLKKELSTAILRYLTNHSMQI